MIHGALIEAFEAKTKVIFLCDGSPGRPPSDGQAVEYTSPNEDWLRLVEKDHCTYFMPLWTLDELRQVALDLGLPLNDDTIEARFEIFGGEARYCLNLDPSRVEEGVHTLRKAIDNISSFEDLRNLLCLKENTATSHRLLHSVPNENGKEDSTKFASTFVIQKLSERMLVLTNRNKESMRLCFSAVPLAGALFEHAHEAFRHNRRLQARFLLPLHEAPPSPVDTNDVVFAIEATETIDEFDSSPSCITREPYHRPKVKSWESIDAFYLKKKDVPASHEVTNKEAAQWNSLHRLLLFQMTVSIVHEVNPSDTIAVLAKLGLLEDVAKDPARVALVFVVPKDLLDSYKRVVESVIGTDKVDTIKGIGKTTATMLKNVYSIETIDELTSTAQKFRNGDLHVEPKDEMYWTRAMNSWEAHGQPQRDAKYGAAMAKIPQYECTWEQ